MTFTAGTTQGRSEPSSLFGEEQQHAASRRASARRGQSVRGTQFAQLTAFVAVAEHRSFTRAAQYLGLSTPSLSQAIRSLEETFGVRLLNRTTRSVAPTEAGEQLLRHLNPVLEGVDNAIDAVNAYRDTPGGTLRLTVHPLAAVTVFGPLIALFSDAYPLIELDVSVDVGCRDIVGEHLDAGIQFRSNIAQDMIAVPVAANFRVTTVAAPTYLQRATPIDKPRDLGTHNCIRYHWDSSSANNWTFVNDGQKADVAVDGSLKVNDHALALRAALDGVGVAQFPEDLVAPLIAEGKLAPVLSDWAPEWPGFYLYYSSRRHVPVKLRSLVDLVRSRARKSV